MTLHYTDAGVTLHHGNCLDVLAELPDESVNAVVTDPPYGLANTDPTHVADTIVRWVNGDREYIPEGAGFMGKAWDAFVPPVAVWDECLRVLKPGGHVLAFAGSRTVDLMTLGLRLAGFDIRDSIAWLYGSGFPKSLDVSKAIDKAAGATRGRVPYVGGIASGSDNYGGGGAIHAGTKVGPAPATPDAEKWEGWGTALKPAFEPIVVARKPLTGTVAANVLAHGTGGLNIDACRIGSDSTVRSQRGTTKAWEGGAFSGSRENGSDAGRWPANVVLDEEQAAALDQQSGTLKAPRSNGSKTAEGMNGTDTFKIHARPQLPGRADDGGASRFFYVAKAPKKERPNVDGIAHPTVKPLALMRWLVRLVTPPGGTVLDPFAGSGATAEACMQEGFNTIAIERETDYLPLILQRIHRAQTEVAARPAAEPMRTYAQPDTRAGEASADRRYTNKGGTGFAMKPGRRYPPPRRSDAAEVEPDLFTGLDEETA